jgi:hypothetical protein
VSFHSYGRVIILLSIVDCGAHGAVMGEGGKARLFDASAVSQRMRARLNLTAERLGKNPQLGLPEALGSAGYKGLMRALSNPRVPQEELLGAVYAATVDRVEAGEELLSIEDTTDLIFGGVRGRKSLPRLESKATGFRAHIALCVRAEGYDVLGVLDLEQIIREDKTKSEQSAQERYDDPDKESLRWQRTVERTEERVKSRATLIHVRDREADDYAQLSDMVRKGERFVQRMRQARVLAKPAAHAPEAHKIDGAMQALIGICEREVPLSSRAQSKFDRRPAGTRKIHPARPGRRARLSFRACTLQVQRPANVPRDLPAALSLNVVNVQEIDPPAGADPIEWYLLTTEPIATDMQVLRIVDHYRARWMIEELNKALQTGCQYEKLQMETAERLWSMLAFYCPIATDLLAMRALARKDADAPAEAVLSRDEIDVLCAELPRLRAKPLTVQSTLLAIAALGGHFTWNGPPGWLVLLRGMAALRERTRGWRLARQQYTRGPP